MKQFTLIVTFITCLLNSAYGQKKTYLGFEFSGANDLYDLTDNGGYLKIVPLDNALGGFTIRQEINSRIFIETGVIMKYLQDGIGFKPIPYYGTSSSDPSWLIPLRFGVDLNLFKEKIFLVPVAGYTVGINPSYGYGVSYGTQTYGTTTITYYSTENPNVSRYSSLLQTGIGFEFKVKALLFSISTNYYFGFNNIQQWDIKYYVNSAGPYTGKTVDKGEFWCVGVGIRYAISNFWTRKGL